MAVEFPTLSKNVDIVVYIFLKRREFNGQLIHKLLSTERWQLSGSGPTGSPMFLRELHITQLVALIADKKQRWKEQVEMVDNK